MRFLHWFGVIAVILGFTGCDIFGSAEVTVEDLTVGTGDAGQLDQTWTIHFTATVQGKTIPFEDTYKSTDPYTFAYDLYSVQFYGVQPEGLYEGLSGMKIGGKRRITVPPSKAWGRSGLKDQAGQTIVPRNATIIFEVELLELPKLGISTLESGSGEEIKAGNVAEVTYKGFFVDGQGIVENGKVFDQTAEGKTFSFQVGSGQVIPGWEQGILGMKVGGKRRLIIPPHLGYGFLGIQDRYTGQYVIPRNATLGFDITLVSKK